MARLTWVRNQPLLGGSPRASLSAEQKMRIKVLGDRATRAVNRLAKKYSPERRDLAVEATRELRDTIQELLPWGHAAYMEMMETYTKLSQDIGKLYQQHTPLPKPSAAMWEEFWKRMQKYLRIGAIGVGTGLALIAAVAALPLVMRAARSVRRRR